MLLKTIAAAGLLVLSMPVVRAQEEPARGVARISLMEGEVSVRRGDSGDYVAAALNAPVLVDDQIVTGSSSRSELQFDYANLLRVSENAEVRLAELEHERYIVQLIRGTVTWRVLRDSDAWVEISTPGVSVRPVRRGIYRISVGEPGLDTIQITVRMGEAELFTPRGSERLRAGVTTVVRGSAANAEARTSPAISMDEWDRWNERRDRDLERSRSYDYLSRDIYGAEDLDDHGRWLNVSGYGWVWNPRVAADWAPYQQGRWTWIDWYGWNWVSHDSWGWAPYHYGRWFHQSPYGWCWYPGAQGTRQRWSPGYVAFFGFGNPGLLAASGWGRVGWVPLAPREPFYPWWGSQHYNGYRNGIYGDQRFTVVNNVNIANFYQNARIRNATTIIEADGFRHGRGGSAIRGFDGGFVSAAVARGLLPLTPERGALRMAERDSTMRGHEERAGSRFFSSRPVQQVDRIPFDHQRQSVQEIYRRTFGDLGAPPATAASAIPVETGRAPESERGWRRIGEGQREDRRTFAESPATPAVPVIPGSSRGNRTGDSEGGEWRRFGSGRIPAAAAPSAPEMREGLRGAPRSESRGESPEWRRFGGGARNEGVAAPPAPEMREGWRGVPRSEGRGESTDSRRFGGRTRAEEGTRGADRPAMRQQLADRMERPAPPVVERSPDRPQRDAPTSDRGMRGGVGDSGRSGRGR